MRVGVCLGDFTPEVGGGYTFVSQVFDAFLRVADTTGDEFVVFCEPGLARSLRESGRSRMSAFQHLKPRSLVEKTVAAAKNYSPLFGALYQRPSLLERAALKHGVQLIWFVGGGVYDTPDIPYIATVWDVQHRTHPWFPEVTARGRWDYRETTHARFLRRAAYIITGTKVGAAQLKDLYQIPEERIRILPHPTPVMPERDGKRAVDGLAGRKFILYPAQFWPHKNHVNLLHAVKMLRDERAIDLDLVLTGSDKGNLAHVRSMIEQLGLSHAVHNLGFVDRETIVWLYKHAVALAYCSFSGPENLPPLEANALGCPVVISDYPGAREQMEHAALYVDPRNPAAIAQALWQVIDGKELAEDLKKQGYANAAARTAAGYVQGVLSIIRHFESVRRCWN